MPRRTLVVGNWKMNRGALDARALAAEVVRGSSDVKCEVVVAPPFTALAIVRDAIAESQVGLAAQNCNENAQGAYTGEISAGMLAELGCRYVIVGHSERRQYFGESNSLVHSKAQSALRAGLRPIICVGESLVQREAGGALDVVAAQLRECASDLDTRHLEVVIAYEPVWAIGTGRTATAAQAEEVHAHLREEWARMYGSSSGAALRIQYGGSVNAANAKELLAQPDIDGALVGGASLKPDEFRGILMGA